jgi:carbon-monoxide dehydrogenase large subunit
MEPRSILVDPTGEQLTVWTSTQVPHFVRIFLALTLGMPESKIRVIAPDVGGGFGGKLQFTPEEVLTVLAAQHTGKPCKYTETRSESLVAAHHGRDQLQRLTLAATRDGTVTGLKVDLLANMGAYLVWSPRASRCWGAFMFNSIYKLAGYRFTTTNVFTNTTVDRCLPRRRPSRGDVRDRAADGRPRGRAGARPIELGAELDQARGVPLLDGRRHDLRLGNYEAPRTEPRAVRL